MMRTVFLSIAGILLHLDAAGRSVFKKRDDFEPTGRFWTSLYFTLFDFSGLRDNYTVSKPPWPAIYFEGREMRVFEGLPDR